MGNKKGLMFIGFDKNGNSVFIVHTFVYVQEVYYV